MAKKAKGKRPPPKCKAILICEQTIVEAVTGKISLIGIYDSCNVAKLPSQTKPSWIFLQLTDGVGTYKVTIEVRNLEEGQVIARSSQLEVNFPERLVTANVMVPLPSLPVHREGPYDLVVLADGQEVDRQKFHVRVMGRDQDDDDATA